MELSHIIMTIVSIISIAWWFYASKLISKLTKDTLGYSYSLVVAAQDSHRNSKSFLLVCLIIWLGLIWIG